jgi:hypothetical protein
MSIVAVEAAPYPPPSDPLLATPDLGHILLPWLGSTRFGAYPPPWRRAKTLDLASALSSGSNFGWSLFFCRSSQNLHGCFSHCAFVSSRRESDNRNDLFSGVRGAAPPRSDASADDPLALPIPSGGAISFPGHSCPIPGKFCRPPSLIGPHGIVFARFSRGTRIA